MKEECLICKAPLEYLNEDVLMECAICHKKELSKTRCVNGHYVCNESRRCFHDRLSLDHCADKLLTVHNGLVHHRIQSGKLGIAQINRDLVVPCSVWFLVFCRRGFRGSPDK